MPTFLQDPSRGMYLLLLSPCVILLGMWLNRQSNRNLYLFLASFLPFLLLLWIDRTHESPREEGVRRIERLAELSQQRQVQEFQEHLADDFRFQNMNRKAFMQGWQAIQQRFPDRWRGAVVWDFARENFIEVAEGHFLLGFSGQAADHPQTQHYIQAEFRRQTDGTYRVVTFHFYDPLQRENGGPRQIPIPAS